MTSPDAPVSGQEWDPERYRRTAAFVPALGMPVLDLLAPQPDEAILDLGCGDGALTVELTRRAGRVVGVDASAEQVAAARAIGLDAHVVAGEALVEHAGRLGSFDAVFSNAALHWMPDAAAVVAGIAAVLKPGGRFVAEFGGAGNIATVRAAIHTRIAEHGHDPAALDPWYYPTPEQYGAVLRDAGFNVTSTELIDRPTPIPGDIGDWLDNFAGVFMTALTPAERPAVRRALVEDLRPLLADSAGQWTVDYVRLRVSARLSNGAL